MWFVRGIDLTISAQVTLDIPREVGAAEQTATVEGQVSQIQTTSSEIGNLVEPTQIANLPLNGHNFTARLSFFDMCFHAFGICLVIIR